MNFTREPIIATVITPKEGCKLIVRNSKGGGKEDYFVDAVEIVTFDNASFFRSKERPKSFLVPASDYEIVELRETKMMLKSVPMEKSIKIGGGKEEGMASEQASREERLLKRRRSHNKKRHHEEGEKGKISRSVEVKGGDKDDEMRVSSSIGRKLFPPPDVLIKERLGKVKNSGNFEENISSGKVEDVNFSDKEKFEKQ